jgi:hypothetical protein
MKADTEMFNLRKVFAARPEGRLQKVSQRVNPVSEQVKAILSSKDQGLIVAVRS